MSKHSLLLTAKQELDHQELYHEELKKVPQLKESEFLRDIYQLGLAYKKSQNMADKLGSPEIELTPVEEELLRLAYATQYATGELIKNSYDITDSKYESVNELIKKISRTGVNRVEDFKVKLAEKLQSNNS